MPIPSQGGELLVGMETNGFRSIVAKVAVAALEALELAGTSYYLL